MNRGSINVGATMKNLSKLLLAVTVLAMTVIMPVLAFAEEAAKSATEIDLSGVTPEASLIGLIGSLLLLGVYKLLSKIPLFNKYVTQEQYQKLVEPLLDNAVAYGVGKLKDADWLKVDTHNAAVANAVQFALDHGGDLLKKFNISQEALEQKIAAKLVANGWDTNPGRWDS